MYRTSSGKSLPALLLLAFGILVTGLLAWSIHETDRRQLIQKFENEATLRANALHTAISQFHVDVVTIRAFFNASVSVSSQEFCQFVTPLVSKWLSDHPHFAWVPRFPADAPSSVLDTTGRTTIASFGTYQLDRSDIRPTATHRYEYHYILYYEPHDSNAKFVGFDAMADPLHRSLLEKARDTGIDLLTNPVPLLGEQATGFLLIVPVYTLASPPATLEERRQSYVGAIIGSFQTRSLMESILRPLPPTGLAVELLDDEPHPQQTMCRFEDALFQSPPPSSLLDHGLRPSPLYHPFTVSGRRWAVMVTPSNSFLDLHGTNEYLIVFWAGLLISILLSLYLHALLMTRERAEMMVVTRTSNLAATEARFRAILESTDEAIALFSRDGTIEAANSRFARFYQETPTGILGRKIDHLFADSVREKRRQRYQQVVETGQPLFVEDFSNDRWYSVKLFPLFDDHQQVVSIASFTREITETKKHEAEQREFQARLQHTQKLESLGVLAGGIAHDFNNLLTAILGYSELISRHPAATTDTLQASSEIRRISLQAADLCRQLLAYSGKGLFDIRRVNLRSLVEEMKQMLLVSISKKVIMKLVFEEGIPEIDADPSQICQILMNLVINSSDAIGDKPGTLLVRIAPETCSKELLDGCINGSHLEPGLYAAIEVTDDGCGIDPAILPRIFDPFFTTKFTGRGLGLAAVLGAVGSHKGCLCVTSTLGKGTTIRVFLPATRSTELTIPAAPVATSEGRIGGRALLVDDEEIVRKMTAQMLELFGCTVALARDGNEALEVFRPEPSGFRFALIDMTMPGISGDELFRELRALRPDLPVIICSGYSESEIKKCFGQTTALAFLPKPFLLQDLKDAITVILQGDSSVN
ncbi:MAG TPA: CHASE domain-containing protein [Candidatus Ozemobacteraceae bacterium]